MRRFGIGPLSRADWDAPPRPHRPRRGQGGQAPQSGRELGPEVDGTEVHPPLHRSRTGWRPAGQEPRRLEPSPPTAAVPPGPAWRCRPGRPEPSARVPRPRLPAQGGRAHWPSHRTSSSGHRARPLAPCAIAGVLAVALLGGRNRQRLAVHAVDSWPALRLNGREVIVKQRQAVIAAARPVRVEVRSAQLVSDIADEVCA